MGMFSPGVGEPLPEIEQDIAMPPVKDSSILKSEKDKLMDRALPYYA